MDNGIAITNLAYQPDQDAVSKRDEQITEFVNPICAEIDKNENIVKNFPSIYENPDDLKRVAMPDENEEEKKSSDSHCLFGAKRAEPNHYEDY